MQTCKNHPDRDAFISCQRCDQPICPQCQVVAPVGFQCPTCVKAGSRGVREARTAYGGRIAERPIVTYVLVGVGVALLALGYTPIGGGLFQVLGFSPSAGPRQPWRYLSYALAGGGSVLPFISLFILYVVGRESEHLLGRLRLIVVWALSAVGGAVGLALIGQPNHGLYGSAAATLGLGTAWFLLNRAAQRRQPALWILVLVVVITVISSPVPAVLGSTAVGAACGVLLARTPRDRRILHWVGFAALFGLLLVLAVVGALLTAAR